MYETFLGGKGLGSGSSGHRSGRRKSGSLCCNWERLLEISRKDRSRRHHGLQKVEGPEYETIYAFRGLCVVNQIEEIIYLNDISDRLGLDTISAGSLRAFAIEASETGRIKEKN